MPLILGTNSIKDTGYNVASSLRFNPGSSDTLSRTLSTPTNNKKFTFSFWFKKCENGREQHFVNGGAASSQFYINSSDQLYFYDQTAGGTYKTTQVFRDVSAWMHIVVAEDTTQGTASSRIRIYVNGSEITDFAIETDPTQNNGSAYNTAATHTIGTYAVSPSGYYYSGYLAEFVFVDGQQLAPTDFGEFDSDSPTIWKPKDVSGLTFGNNGFHLDFEDSSALGNDVSGNNNDFTVNNLTAIDQSTDTCTNNFATINSLFRSRFENDGVLSEGNLKLVTGPTDGDKCLFLTTQGVTQGKWYWEIKDVGGGRAMIGVGYDSISSFSDFFGENSPSNGFAVYALNGNLYYDNTNTSYGSATSANDIIMVALDMDNHLCWFGKNGTWFDSATQSEIENSTSTNDATTQMGTQQNLNSGEPVFPLVADSTSLGDIELLPNFGSPAFSISSGNADGRGYGNFEYSVPSNYYSLNTKNLAEFG